MQSRRQFLTSTGAAACAFASSLPKFSNVFAQDAENAAEPSFPLYAPGEYRRIDATERVFHISALLSMFGEFENLPEIWRESGVSDVWLCAWICGHYHGAPGDLEFWADKIKKAGLRPHLIGLPLGHPAGSPAGNGHPTSWKPAERWDGSAPWGCSLHSPATVENVDALRTLYRRFGKCDYFLDDDFRLSTSPNSIGGCVCPECRAEFLKSAGLDANRWNETLDDLKNNADTPLLRAWIDHFCDKLTASFDAQRAAAPEIDLGIMVMYIGCERGGIRLDDYRDRGAFLRVGEGMFGDDWFNLPQKKTVELFSSLFHRRFCEPGRAFSETTVYPKGALSAENLAAKLSVSTISDVRNTCFMSGEFAIPPAHWPTLSARMKREKAFHSRLLGQKPSGPFKHFYGKAARYLAGPDPYSLFLGVGVPFEVCETIPADGWTFLGDADAAEVERGALSGGGSELIARFASSAGRFEKIDENLESLFAFRRSILPRLQADEIPYVEEEKPVVLAWYPDVKLVYLWNLTQEKLTLRVRCGTKTTALELGPVDSALIDEAAFV